MNFINFDKYQCEFMFDTVTEVGINENVDEIENRKNVFVSSIGLKFLSNFVNYNLIRKPLYYQNVFKFPIVIINEVDDDGFSSFFSFVFFNSKSGLLEIGFLGNDISTKINLGYSIVKFLKENSSIFSNLSSINGPKENVLVLFKIIKNFYNFNDIDVNIFTDNNDDELYKDDYQMQTYLYKLIELNENYNVGYQNPNEDYGKIESSSLDHIEELAQMHYDFVKLALPFLDYSLYQSKIAIGTMVKNKKLYSWHLDDDSNYEENLDQSKSSSIPVSILSFDDIYLNKYSLVYSHILNVFTNTNYRKRGYASNLCYQFCKLHLESDSLKNNNDNNDLENEKIKREIFLNCDTNNPTSNKIYQSLGFEIVVPEPFLSISINL